jgi:hypothetical protein
MLHQRTTASAVICLALGLVGAASPIPGVAENRPATDHGNTLAIPPEGGKQPTGPTPT